MQTKKACGYGFNTVTVSDDGTAYSFGRNRKGELGLGYNNTNILLPTPIPNLPKINILSCGLYFTVCVDDEETCIWSFGDNNYG